MSELNPDMLCHFCGVFCCPHGAQHVKGNKVTCLSCNASPPENYCLPVYEGKYEPDSDVYTLVCKSCHDKYIFTLGK